MIPSAALFSNVSYDYVIAGGGTAGLALAARLTEDPKISVAVIEAGEDRSADLAVSVWGLTGSMMGKPDYDWDLKTTPQADANNRTISWPRGRQLGGSSGLNYWYWNHASRRDLDDWTELGNDIQGTKWDWESIFPFYLKSETYYSPQPGEAGGLNINYVNPEDHGKDGPIKTSFAPVAQPVGPIWDSTFKNLGLEIQGDPYGGSAIGSYDSLVTQDPGNLTRSYVTTGYYTPNARRTNLHVLTGALVNNIVFQPRSVQSNGNLIAQGLNFTHSADGKTYIAKANKEVILSAGVIQEKNGKVVQARARETILSAGGIASPQILELSGIGNKDILAPLGIDVRINNPNVGENLQDHVYTTLSFEAADGVPTNDKLTRDPAVKQAAIDEYLATHKGILTQINSNTAYLSYTQILRTAGGNNNHSTYARSALPSEYTTDTQILRLSKEGHVPPHLHKQYVLTERKLLNPLEPAGQILHAPSGLGAAASTSTGSYISLVGLLAHPFSRGSIHINSSEPTAPPVIDPKFLSNPLDLDLLGTIAFAIQKIAQTEPLASLLKNKGTVFGPGNPAEGVTPQNVKEHVRATLGDLQHPLGTCSMGPSVSEGAVVDPRLRVYGTENVRIVDASVIPLQPVGTIQSLVYALAERAAEIIRGRESGRPRS